VLAMAQVGQQDCGVISCDAIVGCRQITVAACEVNDTHAILQEFSFIFFDQGGRLLQIRREGGVWSTTSSAITGATGFELTGLAA